LCALLDPDGDQPDGTHALTGAIDASGSVHHVDGYPAKIKVVEVQGLDLMVPGECHEGHQLVGRTCGPVR
jgi:hypothetical protein